MLRDPKRLVYAYDELQNLSGNSLPPPEEIFGKDRQGRPLVTFDNGSPRDVILPKCYRNSRPVLVAAHSLGFGIYRQPPEGEDTGLVQMFDPAALWTEIGYSVYQGKLAKGHHVVLERTNETSPRFLEEHSEIQDLVQFQRFRNEADQNEWLVDQIRRNLEDDELRYDDIIVIHPDPISARERVGPIRKRLYEMGIQTHLAGVDTLADVFFRTDHPSITFTGIFRAKGNEAGMVYGINAQKCETRGAGLASLRNRLFTAITRSKAWVRVVGHGPKMDSLIREFKELERKEYRLAFKYPTDDQLRTLRRVHQDLSPAEKQRLEKQKNLANELAKALERGELKPEDLDEKTRSKLRELLGGD